MEIQRLILQTSALKELTAFYSDLMELPVRSVGKNEIRIKTCNTELIFKETVRSDPFYHFAINIPANKIEEAKAWLNDRRTDLLWIEQYKSDIADFTGWHAKSVYFYDPAGNILELIARFDLDNKTDEPFSSKQFLSISEVGLVFKEGEFEKRTADLLQQYQLSHFAKQPPLRHFRAIGDDEGLFIVVPENRNWFPTDKPAGIFSMEIEFMNGRRKWKLKN
jgi:hypothetical protein